MKNRFFAFCSVHAILVFSTLSPNPMRGEEPAADRQEPKVLEEIDVPKGGDLVIVPVTISGKAYPFVLGTNSHRTVVDVRLRHLLGKSLGKMRGQEEFSDWEEFPPLPMKVGKIEFTADQPVQCANLAGGRELSGHDLYGIVGLDFLREQVVQIDFDQGKLRVLSAVPPGLERPKWVPHIMNLFVKKSSLDYPMIMQKIEGYGAATFVVDTSMSGPVLMRARIMRQLIKEGLVSGVQQETVSTFDGRAEKLLAGRLRGLVANGCASVCDAPVVGGRFSSIGLGYLSRFQLTFDFKNNELYMIPGAKFDQPFERDWLGFEIVFINNEITVMSIVPKAPADDAGVQAGDVLLDVNEEMAAKYSLFQLRELLSGPKPLTMTFRRGDRDVSVRLQRPAPEVSGDEPNDAGGAKGRKSTNDEKNE